MDYKFFRSFEQLVPCYYFYLSRDIKVKWFFEIRNFTIFALSGTFAVFPFSFPKCKNLSNFLSVKTGDLKGHSRLACNNYLSSIQLFNNIGTLDFSDQGQICPQVPV